MQNVNNFQIAKVQTNNFQTSNFSLALLINVLLIKKVCINRKKNSSENFVKKKNFGDMLKM